MATKAPTVDEWAAELERLTRDDPGETAQELAARAGVSINAIRGILLRGVRDGRYIEGRARRAGQRGLLKVYRIAKGVAK